MPPLKLNTAPSPTSPSGRTSSSSSSSSENGHDEVFGVFSDSDRSRGGNESSVYGTSETNDNDEDHETSGMETDDEGDDSSDDMDQESANGQFTKGLRGWTDDEITKGRIKVAFAKLDQTPSAYI